MRYLLRGIRTPTVVNRILARLLAASAGLAVVATSLVLTDGVAVARPNCDVDDPPPICGPRQPTDPVPADLQVQVAGPAGATAGDTATYTVTVRNAYALRSVAARGFGVGLSAAGATVRSASSANGWPCSTTGCSGGSLAAGASGTITVVLALSPNGGTATLTATVDPTGAVPERNESNNTASASTALTVPLRPDLTVTMTAPGTVRGVYANGAWTMVITNRGPVAASPVRLQWLTDWSGWLNANYTWSGAVHPTCFPPAEYAQQTVNCLLDAPLAAGASVTIVITAVPPAPGGIYTSTPGRSTVTATVDYLQEVAESDETNNVATTVTTITS